MWGDTAYRVCSLVCEESSMSLAMVMGEIGVSLFFSTQEAIAKVHIPQGPSDQNGDSVWLQGLIGFLYFPI